jgi:serine/threonine protein kinase/Leucine-rich repeat (LRR) protein
MPEPRMPDESQLDRQLAELDENPAAPVDSTVRGLHAELETLAKELKQPLSPDPFQDESACRDAVAAVQSLVREMAPGELPSAAGPATPMPERLEHFRIVKLLGQGGMGAVYLAEDTRLGRQVAIKTLKPELAANPTARERFLREARLAAALEHDHICPIYHVGEDNGIPYLAMPLLKGESLEELLRRRQRLAPVQVIRLGIQIAAGLAAAHEKGLIHRDIKPGNLWVEPVGGGRIKILDFGLARSIEADTCLTQAGAIVGTPSYMAPEQARGDKLDARADLYSLGVVLYRLATGELPLKGVDTMSMLLALAINEPTPPHVVNPEVPAELSVLIMRLLAKEPSERPASAQDVMRQLQALQKAPAETSHQTQPLPQRRGSEKATPDRGPEKTTPARGSEKATPARGSGPRSRWPLVAAGLLFAFFGGGLLLQQIILRITDKEGKTREIELKPGDRIEIVEKSAPKPDPTTTPPKKEPEIKIIAGDPDRRAAEYVLSLGGVVRVNGSDREVRAAADLPKEPFRLTWVSLFQNRQVTDAGLAHFKDCKNLTYLNLGQTPVTDAGLAHFKDCKGLTYLELWGTRVTDGGLAHFKDCKDLTVLSLHDCRQVTDAGLAHFKDCKNLMGLDLRGTQVTDAGLAHFKDCKGLTGLDLTGTRVTDAGLAHFQECKGLRNLQLGDTRVTDAGLAHFKDCKNLTHLDLTRTHVTDAGLALFKDCKGLTSLALGGTHVTDVGLAHFHGCKNLTYLSLYSTRVTDAGLAHFQDCKNLTHLDLARTQVTDAGLAHLEDCKALTSLYLEHTQVTDASLFWIGGQLNLTGLRISGTRISLLGYEQLKAALPKCNITWSEPNRSVAESVLALGGTVEIGFKGQPARPVKSAEELPRELFQVRRVSLTGVTKPLDKLPELLSQLRFNEFDRLEKLDLTGIKGLNYAFLAPIAGLEELSLANAGLNDASLGQLPKMPALKRLVLDGNDIRGTGLTALSTQPALVDLSLGCPTLTDLYAKNLAELKQLKRLSLAGSSISDAAIQHLEGLTNLEMLDLSRTKITQAGVERLRKALPACTIQWAAN